MGRISKVRPLLFRSFSIACLILISSAANGSAWNGRNQALRDIPVQTWVNVTPFQGNCSINPGDGGSAEVPWAYDANKKIFVRLGGCTNIYSNEVCFFDMGTITWSFPWVYDASGPTDRPGCGCNRGLCYDAVTKNVWTVGAASSGCSAGKRGVWRGDMTAHSWRNITDSYMIQGHVACDTALQKIVFAYADMGTFRHVDVYDLLADSIRHCAVMPGSSAPQNIYYPVTAWNAMEYVPVMNGVMMVGWMNKDSARGFQAGWFTWFFDTRTETWTDLKAGGLPSDYNGNVGGYDRVILSYDPVAQVVLLMNSGHGMYVYTPGSLNTWVKLNIALPSGWTEMFEYDPEHNVHAFVGNSVWAFRYANDGTGVQRMGGFSLVQSGIDCYPNPFRTMTRITYGLAENADVNLSVYDLQGRLLRKLVDAPQAQGTYSILWKDFETHGQGFPVSTYVIRLESGKQTTSKIAVVLK